MARLVLWGAGVMMLVVGALNLVAPEAMMAAAGIELTTVNHHHIIRAAYGGAYIGIGILFLLGVLLPALRKGSLLAVAVLFSGFGVGRIVSLMIDGVPVALYLAVLAFEVTFATLACLALRRE